jgi:formylmethanofuran dehydrogenase subunit E
MACSGTALPFYINKGKTNILVCSRDENAGTQVKINDQIHEEVQEFIYLGSKITKDRSKKEIDSRIN